MRPCFPTTSVVPTATSIDALGYSLSIFLPSSSRTSYEIMQFPFTFSLSIPGLHNPFLAKSGPVLAPSRNQGSTISRLPPRFPPANSLSPPVPLARKRGWIPSEPAPSHAATSATSTVGYLDTPAKYRDIPLREPEEEVEEMIAGVSSCAHIPYPTPPRHISLVCNPTSHPTCRRHRFLNENEPSSLHPTHLSFTCSSLATCSSLSM